MSLRSFIAYQVKEGFDSKEEIIEQATAYACENLGRDNAEPEVKRLTTSLLAAHRRKQRDWQGLTDCDKLDQAFQALDQRGIVARQNFSCCNNCGHREIWDEIEAAEEQQTVEGYVFYHFQCIETAIKSGTLWMAYGAVEEDEEALQRVGRTIVQELRNAGLNAEWDGNIASPITITDLVWRRRR